MPVRPAHVPVPVRLLAATALASGAFGLAVLAAPAASATDAPTFTFPQFGTVVVSGTVTDSLNYTVYRITNPDCSGTDFPGANNSCVPQQATDTVVIPAGTYKDKAFALSDVPACGPAQQDVYNGSYQPTITASGTHQFLAGGIVQLGACKAAVTPPSSSAPAPTTSAPAPTATTPVPTTTSPSPVTTTPSGVAAVVTSSPSQDVDATGAVVVATTSSAVVPAAVAPAAYLAATRPTLANTGPADTAVLLATGIGAVALGGVAVAYGHRRTARVH